jgi:anti-anti-sigma factor
VQLHAEIDPDAVLRVRVTDVGHWREPGAEADRARVNRGRGLILMDGLMDQVQVRTDRAGSAVELCKQLPPLRTPAPAPALSKMQLHRATADGALVVTGDIDYVAAPVLRDALQADPAAPAAEQVLDLRAVGYLESAALAVLWEHAHRLRLLVTEDTAVATLMRITGLIHAATVEFTPPS